MKKYYGVLALFVTFVCATTTIVNDGRETQFVPGFGIAHTF